MTLLLDGNVLVALATPQHVHSDRVHRWWPAVAEHGFATCPITQGTLVRLLIRGGATASEARAALASFTSHPRHEFWPDDLDYGVVDLRGVIGHRQVTDAYLLALARAHAGRLATLDAGLVTVGQDDVVAVPR